MLCNQALVSCSGPKQSFHLNDDDYGQAGTIEANNAMRQNRILVPPKGKEPLLVNADTKRYSAVFLPSKAPDGVGAYSSFAIQDDDVVIWDTDLHYFGGFSADGDRKTTIETRVRITPYGHLVQEARNIYQKGRNFGDWLTVWSSVPSHLNYTVGVYGDVGYMLILQVGCTLNSAHWVAANQHPPLPYRKTETSSYGMVSAPRSGVQVPNANIDSATSTFSKRASRYITTFPNLSNQAKSIL